MSTPQFTSSIQPRETLSSAQTFLMKFIFPLIWIGGFTASTAAMFLSRDGGTSSSGGPGNMKWLFLTITVVGTIFISLFCGRLKKVEIDGQALYISNYMTQITVPLFNVAEVTENLSISNHPVTIRFHSATEFGQRIVFIPKMRMSAPEWSSHPVVQRLRDAAAGAGGMRRDAVIGPSGRE